MPNVISGRMDKLTETVRRLTQNMLAADLVCHAREESTIVNRLYNVLDAKTREELVHGKFTPPQEQIDMVRRWNRRFGWGFLDGEFAAVEHTVPEWPKKSLVAVVLVPYLPERDGKSGLERTLIELLGRATVSRGPNYRFWNDWIPRGPDRIRLLPGVEHVPGLRWEVIDLGCNRGRSSAQVLSSQRSPHAGILAAAGLHPRWLDSMDGDMVPNVIIPGYLLTRAREDPWRGVLAMCMNRPDHLVMMCNGGNDMRGKGWAVPEFYQEESH